MMKNIGMQLLFATITDENKIKKFLKHNNLLHQDITPLHLHNFLLLWDGSKLVGTVGLEIKDHCALHKRPLRVAAVIGCRGSLSEKRIGLTTAG
jgi:hypothetical protein